MTAVLPKNVELFFRRALCCFCCGLEANVGLQNYSHISTHASYLYSTPSSLNNIKYETTAFLTWEDILKLMIPLCFSFLSFCGMVFHVLHLFFYDEAIHTKIALVAFVSFITSTFVCRYIYTFETNIKRQLKLVLLSNLICLEKYFALFIAISSFITLIFDLFTYISISEDNFLKDKLSNQEKTLFFIQFLWETSVFIWSSLWYKLVLRAEKYALENTVESALPPLNFQAQRNRTFFPQETQQAYYPYYHNKGCEAFIANRNNLGSTNAKYNYFSKIESENPILVDSPENNKKGLNNSRHIHYYCENRQNNIYAFGSVYVERNLNDGGLNKINSSTSSNMLPDGGGSINNKEEGKRPISQKKEESSKNNNGNTEIVPLGFESTYALEFFHEGINQFVTNTKNANCYCEGGDSAWLLRDGNTLPVAIGRPLYSCYTQNDFLDNPPNSYYNIYHNHKSSKDNNNNNSNNNNDNSNNNNDNSNNNNNYSNNNNNYSNNNNNYSNNNNNYSNSNNNNNNNNNNNSNSNNNNSNNNNDNSNNDNNSFAVSNSNSHHGFPSYHINNNETLMQYSCTPGNFSASGDGNNVIDRGDKNSS